MVEGLKAALGAHLVLVVDGELAVANVDEELHRANPERLVEA